MVESDHKDSKTVGGKYDKYEQKDAKLYIYPRKGQIRPKELQYITQKGALKWEKCL
jgi:hypothetical protein